MLDPDQYLPSLTCAIGNEPRAGKHCHYPTVAQIAGCRRDAQGQEPQTGSQRDLVDIEEIIELTRDVAKRPSPRDVGSSNR